jgi:hypothetical protein
MNNILLEYFEVNDDNKLNKWQTDLNCYPISGYSLITKIKEINPKKIIDVGCGYNDFKKHIPNIIGIDIANKNADHVMDIMDYPCEDNSVDVILALGSINFGTKDTIEKQVEWIASKLKTGGLAFFRVNPSAPPSKSIEKFFYKWDIETIYELSKKFNLDISENKIEVEERLNSPLIRNYTNNFENIRLFFTYIKK